MGEWLTQDFQLALMSWWSVLEACSSVVGGPVLEKLLVILGLYCCESLVVSILVYVCDLVSAL